MTGLALASKSGHGARNAWNLGEFFMMRVSMQRPGLAERSRALLQQVGLSTLSEQADCCHKTLVQVKHGILLRRGDELTARGQKEVTDCFDPGVAASLKPLVIDLFPLLSNLDVFLLRPAIATSARKKSRTL